MRAGDVQRLDLTVESERGTIKGDVRDAQGAPLPDAFVRAEREPEPAPRRAPRRATPCA